MADMLNHCCAGCSAYRTDAEFASLRCQCHETVINFVWAAQHPHLSTRGCECHLPASRSRAILRLSDRDTCRRLRRTSSARADWLFFFLWLASEVHSA